MDRLVAANTVPFGSHDTAPTTGTPGMATDGNAQLGIPPTIFPAWSWNMLEEEMRNVVVAGGATPDRSNWTQLLLALRSLFNVGVSYSSTDNGLLIFPGGLFRLVVTAAIPSGAGLQTTTLTLPFTFPNTCLDAQVCFLGNGPPSSPGSISVQPISRSQVTISSNFSTSSTGLLGVCVTTWGN